MAATKTKGTRNTERKNGKAWRKDHAAPAKVLSPEDQARKATKQVKRSQRPLSEDLHRGSSITMPRITWRWAQETMAARWPNTRRVRMLDAVLAQERGRPSDGAALVEPNPEAKSSRKNGR